MQVLSSILVLAVKMFIDTSWVDSVYFTIQDYGLMSSEYFNLLCEIIYPALIIADILIILPFIIKDKLSFLKPISKSTGFIYFLEGIVLNAIVSWVVVNIPEGIVSSDYENLMSVAMTGSPVLVMLCSGILAPIVEELIFRFGIFKMLENKSDIYKIIVSSLLFGLAHMNLVQSTYAFVLGLILGSVYAKNKNLVPSLILHLTINATSVLYEFSRIQLQGYMLLVVSIASLYLLVLFIKSNFNIKIFLSN